MVIKTPLSALLFLSVGCTPQQGVDREAELDAILQADRAWSETPPNVEPCRHLFRDLR